MFILQETANKMSLPVEMGQLQIDSKAVGQKLLVEMGQLQIDSKVVGQKLSAEHNNVGDGERKMATERIENSCETEDRIPTPTHLEQKENDSRVREKTSGATAKKKLTRKDIKLPEGFENKMAFVLYDVFTEEVIYQNPGGGGGGGACSWGVFHDNSETMFSKSS